MRGGARVALPAEATSKLSPTSLSFGIALNFLTFSVGPPASRLVFHPFKTDTSLDELRRTSIAAMAEHNIVVFAGDHCGPEVT